MDDQIFIQDRFSITDPITGRVFSDALVLPQDEYNVLTSDQITQMKQDRFTNWLTVISTPPIESSVTDQISGTIDQIQLLTDQLNSLNIQASDEGEPTLDPDVLLGVNDSTDQLTLAQDELVAQVNSLPLTEPSILQKVT